MYDEGSFVNQCMQVSVCSSDDLCQPGYHSDRQTDTQYFDQLM